MKDRYINNSDVELCFYIYISMILPNNHDDFIHTSKYAGAAAAVAVIGLETFSLCLYTDMQK